VVSGPGVGSVDHVVASRPILEPFVVGLDLVQILSRRRLQRLPGQLGVVCLDLFLSYVPQVLAIFDFVGGRVGRLMVGAIYTARPGHEWSPF
jgi:hypothetical protein